jgi:hypothetical protein
MTNWYKKSQDMGLPPPPPMPGMDPMAPAAAPPPSSGALGEPEESVQEVIVKANKLLKFFMEEDKEDSKDALMRVSRFLGSKYSPRLWVVDYTKNPPEITDYDGIPLGDLDQKIMAEEKGGDSGGGGLL